MAAIWAKWYFADEAEQEVGPYLTAEAAQEAAILYGKYLDGTNTPEDDERAAFLGRQIE